MFVLLVQHSYSGREQEHWSQGKATDGWAESSSSPHSTCTECDWDDGISAAGVITLWAEVSSWFQLFQLQTVTSTGELGTIMNVLSHSLVHAIDEPTAQLESYLQHPLPTEAIPSQQYNGPSRLIVTTVRTMIQKSEVSLDTFLNHAVTCWCMRATVYQEIVSCQNVLWVKNCLSVALHPLEASSVLHCPLTWQLFSMLDALALPKLFWHFVLSLDHATPKYSTVLSAVVSQNNVVKY